MTPGTTESTAKAANDRGQVVGTRPAADGQELRVYLWDPIRGLSDLGGVARASGYFEEVLAINDRGQVAWTAPAADGGSHAVIRTPGRGVRDLGTLGGASSTVMDLNERGEAVGSTQTETGAVHAFFWSPRTGMRDLGDLAKDDAADFPGEDVAVGLNDRGEVLVRSSSWRRVDDGFTRSDRAYLWEARSGRLRDLGPTAYDTRLAITEHRRVLVDDTVRDLRTGWVKRPPAGLDLHAVDINERGDVVGSGYIEGVGRTAVHWNTRTGRVRHLHVPYDHALSTSIDEHGRVSVGASDEFDDWAMSTDLLWNPGSGRVCRLGEAAYYGSSTFLVGNRGAVAGWGFIEQGAYLWSRHPVAAGGA